MLRHRNCVIDPEARTMWREYQSVLKEGNPLGLSFVEYIAVKVMAQQPQTVTSTTQIETMYFTAACGHRHPWGASCSEMAVTT